MSGAWGGVLAPGTVLAIVTRVPRRAGGRASRGGRVAGVRVHLPDHHQLNSPVGGLQDLYGLVVRQPL